MSTNASARSKKKEQIIEAAARVFARSGYSNAVVADIALQANIGKGTVYEYFKSKEDLFFAVFEWFQKKTEHAAVVGIAALGGGAADRCGRGRGRCAGRVRDNAAGHPAATQYRGADGAVHGLRG